jgi:hypothetical protein
MIFLLFYQSSCVHNHLHDTHTRFVTKHDAICICYELFKLKALKWDIYIISTFYFYVLVNREKHPQQLLFGDKHHLWIIVMNLLISLKNMFNGREVDHELNDNQRSYGKSKSTFSKHHHKTNLTQVS